MSEKILAHYFHDRKYLNADQNAIGATTSLTLRDPDLVTGDESFVRKFGNDYLIKEVTDIENPIDVNMTFLIYALDGTLLGSRLGGGAFVAGSVLAVAQPCYMEIEADGGNVVVLAGIDVETDVDTAPSLTFVCAAETIQDGDTLRLYLSDTASTYYDANYMYGGARHTPIATNERRPFFTITAGLAACAVPVDGVEVQDSATYDEQFVAENRVVAVLGQTPTITSGIGARVTREMVNQGNNTNVAYVSKTLALGGVGTYQDPYTTIAAAIAGIGGRTGIHIMDSETYGEGGTIPLHKSIEPIYGQTPTMLNIVITANSIGGVSGMTISGGSGIGIQATRLFSWINDNTVYGRVQGINIVGSSLAGIVLQDVKRNRVYDCQYGIYIDKNQGADDNCLDVQYNYVTNCSLYGFWIRINQNDTTLIMEVSNNVMINNNWGMFVQHNNFTWRRNIDHNVIIDSIIYGIVYTQDGTITGSTAANIVRGSGTEDLRKLGANPVTATYTYYQINNGWTIGAGCSTNDPLFVSEVSPYKLGLSANSPAGHADANNEDIGILWRIIEINASDIVINGLIITGQNQYNNAIFIADNADHTGLIVRYNSIKNFNGIQLDPYDNDVDTECIITNNKIYDGGVGIKLSYGGNTIENNLIYNNAIFNMWSDYTGQIITHNVFYGGQYGLYLGSNSAGITYRDNISHRNSLYGIYSEVAIIVIYCDITDATFNVDATETTPASRFNFTDDPNFINTNPDEEDYRVKSISGGYIVDSPCIGASSTGIDVGAYEVDRSIDEDSWKKYSFFDNPMNLDDILAGKGVIKQDDALGVTELWMRSNKIQLPFRWGANQASNAEQRKKVRYFTQLVRSRENSLTLEQCKVRIHLLPITKLETGTAATIDATNKTISDTDKSWTENEHKGIHLAVIFTSGSGIVIDATAKTATKAGAGWTVNAWTGYTLYHNYDFYYIVSNSATVLTLSDPLGTLEDETATYSIEKYFKICANSLNQIVVLDPDDELVSGSYNYYIDFIEVRCTRARHQPKQAGYNPEHWAVGKTGYAWDVEEI